MAGHLAAGVPLHETGSPIADPVLLNLPRPRRVPGGLEGEIIHIDHFGNLASNIMLEDLGVAAREKGMIEVHLGPTRITGLVRTFGERRPGEVIALFGSTGNLIVSVVNGSASSRLGVHVGEGDPCCDIEARSRSWRPSYMNRALPLEVRDLSFRYRDRTEPAIKRAELLLLIRARSC